MALFIGLHLQRGDKDQSDPLDPKKPPRYQGTPRSDLTGKSFVVELQEVLRTLGFGLIKPDDELTAHSIAKTSAGVLVDDIGPRWLKSNNKA